MDSIIKLKAILHASRLDRYGAWIVSFEVSQQHSLEVAKLTAMVEQVLDVAIKPEEHE